MPQGSITLDGISLSPSLQWTDRYDHSPVLQETQRTLSGNLVVWHSGINKGRPISLTATTDTGWFTGAMVTAIQAIAGVSGGQYTLDWHGEVFTVMFAHDAGSSVTFSPLLFKVPQLDADYFTGTVKLFTV